MLASRLPAFATPPACSRCFHTDAEGRIPLARNWPAVFSALHSFDEIAVQSRHTYARLIHLGPPPEIVWDEAGRVGRDETGALRLDAGRWGAIHARLALCSCCESPGYIEVLNLRGGDILQLCPTAGTAPAAWAACLEQLMEARTTASASRRLSGFPLMPAGLQTARETSEVLPALFAALGRAAASVRVLLRTPEVTHLREFVPGHVATNYPLFVASDGRTTLQLALPPINGLALAADHSLHLAGPGGTLLLSLAPGPGHDAAWLEALSTCLPSLH